MPVHPPRAMSPAGAARLVALLALLGRPAAAPPARALSLPLADLLERAVQLSGRLHSRASALARDLASAPRGTGPACASPPCPRARASAGGGNELGRAARPCPTAGMRTPDGKETAQRLAREKLTHLVRRLLQAWKEPLSHVSQMISHHQELSNDSLHRAMQISNMVHELEIGVKKVTEKMQSMGIISNSLNGMESSETTGLSISNEANLMSGSDFIHCFRRDSNKVQSYLKILRCRILPENSC